MGGAVSAGEDNDELVDNLVEAEYIKTPLIERVFRAVDRGSYYAEGCKENAYRDLAWKHGNLHLSAPCIYSEVMESLQLKCGMSFLNLGSGTGYLSTMVGLILGPYGINHGVELHEDVVEYARNKLDEFKRVSPALDRYEFCPPRFVTGNCLLLDTSMHQYDRVYCGVTCPTEHENYMKNLICVGGILVMPFNDQLLQVSRTSETTWECKSILPVTYGMLIPPGPNEATNCVKLPDWEPLSLQEICRYEIRTILRRNIDTENPKLKDKKRRHPRQSNRRFRRIVIPIFEESDNDSHPNGHPDTVDDFPGERSTSSMDQGEATTEMTFAGHVYPRTDAKSQPAEPSQDCIAKDELSEFGETSSVATSRQVGANGLDSKMTEGSNGLSYHSDELIECYSSDCEAMDLTTREENSDGISSSGSSDSPIDDSSERKRCVEDEDNHVENVRVRQRVNGIHVNNRGTHVIWKHVAVDELDSDSEKESIKQPEEEVVEEVEGDYSVFMKQKINVLPLPSALKAYLNYLRPM